MAGKWILWQWHKWVVRVDKSSGHRAFPSFVLCMLWREVEAEMQRWWGTAQWEDVLPAEVKLMSGLGFCLGPHLGAWFYCSQSLCWCPWPMLPPFHGRRISVVCTVLTLVSEGHVCWLYPSWSAECEKVDPTPCLGVMEELALAVWVEKGWQADPLS